MKGVRLFEAMKRPWVWIAAGFFALLVWVICLANAGADAVFFDIAKTLPMGDKVGHFVLFGGLTLAVNLALRTRSFRIWRGSRIRVYAGTAVVGVFVVLEELSQAWFPARTLDVRDLLADGLGIACFTALTAWVAARNASPPPANTL